MITEKELKDCFKIALKDEERGRKHKHLKYKELKNTILTTKNLSKNLK
ncbi:hypothetical protein HYV49_05405 [Candidatus Pacearchaeota archaeon]|nr:hypothetical protein [Candidatus Pacearchaeota archaeon]